MIKTLPDHRLKAQRKEGNMNLCKISNKGFSEIAESVLILPSGEENKLIYALFKRFLPSLNGVCVLNALPIGRKKR